MSEQVVDVALKVLKRAPAWIRSELTATDQAVRERAEEALAAMIAAAIQREPASGPT